MVWPESLPVNPALPPVSIVTPTYNRRRFLPYLIECIKAQTYPKERMEWVVLDDGEDKVEDLIAPFQKEFNVRYYSSDTKLNIGDKRNKIHALARGKIIVVFDDDDYYFPERVAHAVHTILRTKIPLVGTSRNHLYFTDDKSIWECGPYPVGNHATFGTMAFTREYAQKHQCDETLKMAEEPSFTNQFKEPMTQLDPMKVMLVICHSENTFNKDRLRKPDSKFTRRTHLKINAFIKNKALRDFYANA